MPSLFTRFEGTDFERRSTRRLRRTIAAAVVLGLGAPAVIAAVPAIASDAASEGPVTVAVIVDRGAPGDLGEAAVERYTVENAAAAKKLVENLEQRDDVVSA